MAGRSFGMLCGGMIALFVLVGYLLQVRPGGLGFIGRTIAQFLVNLAAARSDVADPSSSVRLGADLAWPLEIAVLDLFGIACIWAGGWIAPRRPSGPQSGPERPSPLDDRAVTPL
jgi:hypothetical protein